MVSLIKNQILKHLQRYAKNLSAENINLSTFKGEGELKSLELNEDVLTDLLELPSWLRLTSAWCNKVEFRIQWTKLKRVPIHLLLDEVKIEVETCSELRSMSTQEGTSSKYNYINRVIDGMTISVNTVSINFTSPVFKADVKILRIIVASKTPEFEQGDLSHTKLKDPKKGQILIFKELEWQSVRIEAKSRDDSNLPPLLLLTNSTKCRITIKKQLSDCFVMGCRLALLLEDLVWVLTDSQLKAALHFIDSLSGLIQEATEITRKEKAARKLEVLPEYQAQLAQIARVNEKEEQLPMSKVFAKYDFIETSYHFCCQKIDLHLIDDEGVGRSCHPELQQGGAFQINLKGFQVDYYPYHLASGNRHQWARYKESSSPHTQWLGQAHAIFRSSLLQLIEKSHSSHTHTPLSRDSPTQDPKTSSSSTNPVKSYLIGQLDKLMTACVILRIEDFTLYRVVTNMKKQQHKEFIKGDKDRHSFPPELMTLHAEFTYYYYPGDIAFPLPAPKFYVHLNPVQLNFDVCTLVWLNSFALNLHQSLLESSTNPDPSALPYVDVKIEAIMPRLVLESTNERAGQKDRPRSLHFQVSRASITNVRSLERCSRADLAKCIHAYQLGTLFYGEDFPAQSGDHHVVTEKFIKHVECKDNVRQPPEQLSASSIADAKTLLHREMLWTEAKDVWCILLEPVWGDFYGVKAVGSNRPVPFLDAFPLSVWAHIGPSAECNSITNIRALTYVSNLVSVQINHYQFLFLLRLADEATELTTFLAMDSNRILKRETSGTVVVGGLVPQLEVTAVMPSQCPGKESSGGDVESVIPDSSSIADDVVTNPSIQWNTALTTNLQDGGVYKRSADNATVNSPPEDVTSPQSAKPQSFLSSSMKKGFKNIMSTIDTALKPGDDTSDTYSLRSDGSSDSDNYVVVDKEGDLGDAMFRSVGSNSATLVPATNNSVEIASEVLEEEATITTPSESHSIASSYKRRDLVSIATFKLGTVEFVQQSEGFQSAVKVQISSMSAEECSSIPWDEFQSKFCARSRGWTEMPSNIGCKPRVCARLDHKVLPTSTDKWKAGAANDSWFDNLLTLKIANSELELTLGTISGLADLAEDEVVSQPLPMEISLENVQLHMSEDRSLANITSPGATPLDVSVTNLRVCRGIDGVFRVEPPLAPTPCGTPTTPLESPQTLQLKSENERLRRRLAAMEKLNEENHFLRRCQEETQILRSCLDAAQDNLSSLLEEKRGLLELVQTLQAQSSANETKYHGSSKR